MTDKKAPRRAYRLALLLDADDAASMCSALQNLGTRILCGEVSTGVWGGYDNDAIYELLNDPEMTHAEYYRQLREQLEKVEAKPEA